MGRVILTRVHCAYLIRHYGGWLTMLRASTES